MFICGCENPKRSSKMYNFYKSNSNNQWNIYNIWKSLKVKIYTKDNCIWCDRAKGLLNAHSIDFNEVDLSNDIERQNFYNKIGDNVKTVPQVYIDDKRIGGYPQLKEWLNE